MSGDFFLATRVAPTVVSATVVRASCRYARRLAGIPVLVGVAACLVTPAHAIVDSTTLLSGSTVPALDGEAKLILTEPGVGQFGCTGDLLAGGSYILTAAHCVTGDFDNEKTSAISISFEGGEITTAATKYVVDPGWNGNIANGDDLALIELTSPITKVQGYTLYSGPISTNTIIMIAGYGETGNGKTGAQANTFGVLHYGYTEYFGKDYAGHLYYDFSSNNIGGLESAMIAPGDSGGGSFVDITGTWELVGVHEFNECDTRGCSPNSAYGTIGGDTALAADLSWIDSVDPGVKVSDGYATPEPSTWVMLMMGSVGLGQIARRARGRAASPARA